MGAPQGFYLHRGPGTQKRYIELYRAESPQSTGRDSATGAGGLFCTPQPGPYSYPGKSSEIGAYREKDNNRVEPFLIDADR